MNYYLGDLVIRCPEPEDLEYLYQYKNDPDIALMLEGFTTGYARSDLLEWLDSHRKRTDEVVWVIAEAETNRCLGHLGFYNIDYRVRVAEGPGILLGRPYWGKGYGRRCMMFALDYGFRELNLNRITAPLLATNERSYALCRALGFQEEGRLRQAQFKNGQYIDVILMGLLREDYLARATE